MALVVKYVDMRIQLKDRGGNIVPMIFKTTATTPLGASNLLDTLIPLVQALTFSKVISATYTWGYAEDDISVTTGNGEVEERAELSAALVKSAFGAGQTAFGGISIPAPVIGLFQATSGPLYNVVEPTYAPLQNLLALYEAGFGIAGALTLSDYQTIQDPTIPGNVVGKRVHRKSRKG